MRTFHALALPLLLMLGIFVLSAIPGPTEDNENFLRLVPPTLQNILHVPLFGLLAWLWCRGLTKLAIPFGRALTMAAVVSLAWGALDEVHQYLVPGRFASLTDMALNGAGVCIALAFLRLRSPG